MADYFFLLDAAPFETALRPALAESWQRRSFTPCRVLCETLLPAAQHYRTRYHTGEEPSLVEAVLTGLTFDRSTWRALVSETLLFAASEIPEFQVCAETLSCLLAPQHQAERLPDRSCFAPIQQVHRGSRDLTFGSAIYRPDHAGLNNFEDVRRLTAYLESTQPETWTVDALASLPDLSEADRADELAFAQEWFPPLREMYQRAAARGQVLIHESIY